MEIVFFLKNWNNIQTEFQSAGVDECYIIERSVLGKNQYILLLKFLNSQSQEQSFIILRKKIMEMARQDYGISTDISLCFADSDHDNDTLIQEFLGNKLKSSLENAHDEDGILAAESEGKGEFIIDWVRKTNFPILSKILGKFIHQFSHNGYPEDDKYFQIYYDLYQKLRNDGIQYGQDDIENQLNKLYIPHYQGSIGYCLHGHDHGLKARSILLVQLLNWINEEIQYKKSLPLSKKLVSKLQQAYPEVVNFLQDKQPNVSNTNTGPEPSCSVDKIDPETCEASYLKPITFDEHTLFNGTNGLKLPPFTVLTGRNGSGKTVFLKHIADTNSEIKPILIPSHFTPDFKTRKYTDNNSYDEFMKKRNTPEWSEMIKYSTNKIIGRDTPVTLEYHTYWDNLAEEFITEYNGILQDVQVVAYVESNLHLIAQKIDTLDILEPEDVEPMYIFRSVFRSYQKKIKAIIKYLKEPSGLKVLFDFYRDKLEAETFITKLGDAGWLSGAIEEYIKAKCSETPWDKINKILALNGFLHQIDFDNNKVLLDGDEKNWQTLTSGQATIVSIVALQYYHQELSAASNGFNASKPKVILFDEPDKHLDPDLCKKFYNAVYGILYRDQKIQVVMTTHRIDTIALAPEGSLFMVESITPIISTVSEVHKMQAMFQLTSNLRAFTNYHHRVYIESLSDARFYEGVYQTLRQHCTREREKAVKNTRDTDNPDYYWYAEGFEQPFRLLSERYQLSFYPVSTYVNADGGCKEVIKAVSRDLNSQNKDLKKGTWLSNEPEFHRSYGVTDCDYHKDYGLSHLPSSGAKVAEYICTLKRHSLENFIFDPFVLATAKVDGKDVVSMIKDPNIRNSLEQLRAIINSKPINKPKIQEYIDEFFEYFLFEFLRPHLSKYSNFESLNNELDKLLKKLADKETIKEILKKFEAEIKGKLEECVKKEVEKQSNEQFPNNMAEFNRTPLLESIPSILKKYNIESSKISKFIKEMLDEVKLERVFHLELLRKFSDDHMFFRYTNIPMALYLLNVEKVKIMLPNQEVISIFYPKLFLECRGHDIRDAFPADSKDELIDLIVSSEQLATPLDLAETFFELNLNLRTHVRGILKSKKDMPKPTGQNKHNDEGALQEIKYCNSIIYDNPMLNDNDINNLLQMAGRQSGMNGINKLMEIGLIPERYQMFQNVRKELGAEEAIKLCLEEEHSYNIYLKTIDDINGQLSFREQDSMSADNIDNLLVLDAQGQELIVFDQYTEKLQVQMIHYYQTGELFETARQALKDGYQMVIAPTDIRQQYLVDTKEASPPSQIVTHDERGVKHYTQEHMGNICANTNNVQEVLTMQPTYYEYGYMINEKLMMQWDWYYQTGEILPTLRNVNTLGIPFITQPTSLILDLALCMIAPSVQTSEFTEEESGFNTFITLGCIAQLGYSVLQQYINSFQTVD